MSGNFVQEDQLLRRDFVAATSEPHVQSQRARTIAVMQTKNPSKHNNQKEKKTKKQHIHTEIVSLIFLDQNKENNTIPSNPKRERERESTQEGEK